MKQRFIYLSFMCLLLFFNGFAYAQDVIQVESAFGCTGELITVPITIDNPDTQLRAFGFDLAIDSAMLTLDSCEPGDLATDFDFFDCSELNPDLIRVGGFDPDGIPAGSSGTLALLHFTVTCGSCTESDTSTLEPQNLLDDIAGWNVVNGTFTYCPPCHHGDVNFSGSVTAGDAQLAFNFALEFITLTPEEECAADCNDSGNVTAGDAQAIFNTALELGTCADSLPGKSAASGDFGKISRWDTI